MTVHWRAKFENELGPRSEFEHTTPSKKLSRASVRALRAIRRTSFCNAGHGRNTMSARRLGQWRDRESAEVDQGSHSLRMQGARFDGSLQGDTTLVEFR